MNKKRTSHDTRKPKPRALASGIPVHCLHDEIAQSRDLKLWGEQHGSQNPQFHPPKQLDRYEVVVRGNGYRRAAKAALKVICSAKSESAKRAWETMRNRGSEVAA